ncbi:MULTISPECIES: AraC family transcriptional regulator [unclassified Prevotella]|uniref:AraC family transcriptional regulator n=1 Tax=unclassified Prevotella TaxID=2638335 RepID=UPI00048C898F|nr:MULTISPECIES: AraC family transcriptional regulator [unclassified Prevotella]
MIRKKDGFKGEQMVVLAPAQKEMAEKDELCQSLFITDIGYYPKAEHHHRIRQQGIEQYVLIYCVEGDGWYIVEGQQHEVRKNQFFILPKGKPHEYGTNQRWTIYWVHFGGITAHVYAQGAATPQSINVAINSRIGERLNIFEEILTTLQQGKELEDMRYASSLLHHFLASMRYLGKFRRAKTETEADIVDQAIHYMRENIENHIMMEDVLQYIGYSQSHFTSTFKKKTGHSPIAYFNQLKIEHACKLLRTTDMKINMICYKVGIEDALYFSRLFTKIVGMPPSVYRESKQ